MNGIKGNGWKFEFGKPGEGHKEKVHLLRKTRLEDDLRNFFICLMCFLDPQQNAVVGMCEDEDLKALEIWTEKESWILMMVCRSERQHFHTAWMLKWVEGTLWSYQEIKSRNRKIKKEVKGLSFDSTRSYLQSMFNGETSLMSAELISFPQAEDLRLPKRDVG